MHYVPHKKASDESPYKQNKAMCLKLSVRPAQRKTQCKSGAVWELFILENTVLANRLTSTRLLCPKELWVSGASQALLVQCVAAVCLLAQMCFVPESRLKNRK